MTEKTRQNRHSMRLSVLVILLGMLVEVSVLVNDFAIRRDYEAWANKIPIFHGTICIQSTASAGFLGSFLVVYGLISFSNRLRISRSALRWVYLASGIYIITKASDVVITI